MNRTRFTDIAGSLIIGTVTLIVAWALVVGGAPVVADTMDTCPTDLFFSEYIEGSSYNKAIEIYNGTGSDITFTGQYTLALYSNGSASVSQFVALSGSIAQGDVFVIAHGSAQADILNEADQISNSVINFNGNDAIALYKNGVLIDVIGQIGVDPGSGGWGSGDTSTTDHTLVRKSHIMAGDTDGSDAFDPADEWDGYPQNTFIYLGYHIMDACGATFSISKSAPAQVKPNQVFTYTLIVRNNTGVTPTTTTITDVVPTGAAYVAASDGGTESDGVVSWTVSDLADGKTVTRTFQVTATAGHGVEIENDDYGVNGGGDWITTTTGTPVMTMVMGECDSIYNIQYPGGPSLCSGETVAVEGVVYAVYGSNSFAIAEDTGPWHGVYVYDSSVSMPEIGDSILITGTVSEYFGLTQLRSVTYTVLATDVTPYAASVISTAEAADGEAYEGVLVEVRDVIVSDENLGFGEWGVDDGSGQVYVDDPGMGNNYTYTPKNGDALDLVRGMLNYSYSNYKIAPRDDNDIVRATGTGLLLDKQALSFVPPGDVFTYTLTFENQTAQTINDLWISDTLPFSLTYASSNPAGTWDEATHTITWTESASIAHGDRLSYTIVVTAPTEMTVVSNADYVVRSSDWPTPTLGDPVETLIRDCNTIYGIQYTTDPGSGTYPSPCVGESVTVRGIVYAVYGSNYFIAEDEGPWHGIYVYRGGNVSVGDEVEVTGNVVEYYGFTEFSSPSNVEVLSSGNPLYGPSLVTVDEIPYDDPDVSEGYESVFVEVRDITVTAEANNYWIWTFTDATGEEGKADDWGYRAQPSVGDEYAVLRGPLAYDYSEYKIMPRDADDALEKGIVVIAKEAPATVDLGGTFTYTLTIANQMGFTLNDLVITDTVPDNTTFAYALDGGAEANGVVSWTVPSLDYLDEISVRFVVTAANVSAVIVNDDYAVSAANYVTPTFGAPVNTAIGELRIYHLQGEGFVSPYVGQEATVEGVVTADLQADDEMKGFFMQDPVGDGITTTSDGIFVYSTRVVSAGDWVEVTGVVQEYNEMTQIGNVSALTVISSGNTIEPTVITLPEDVNDEMERYEGMLVTIPHTLTVQQNYFQGRFGQVTLGSGDRMYQPTHLHEPGSAAYWDQVDENARRLLVLDDGSSAQNPDPIPYIGVNDTLRAGDVVSTGLTGVLDQGPINTNVPTTKDYRLHPTQAVNITRVNERTDTPPDVGGRLRVASFNVLNYFNGDGMGGGFPTSRGADTLAEFIRQRTKIITAVLALDADVIGLMEIENDGYDEYSAIADLVNGLNDVAGAGTYAFVDPGVPLIGTDEIAVGLIYKPGSVTPVGAAAILDNTFDPTYRDDYNRPALAQTFAENASGEKFTAAVNHLKSKGSSCDAVGDPDTGDGQGNCNLTRTRAMTVELAWLATDPTGSGDPDFIILGDLNAYAMEDPIAVARNAGYTDLLGAAHYTYIFDGMSGYLDHALANPSLNDQVTGATVWHINADEPSVIDYNTEYKPQDLYAPHAFRSSDHDPVLVGLDLVNQTGLTVTKRVAPTTDVPLDGGVVTYTVVVRNDGTAEATGVVLTDTLPPEVDFRAWVDQGSAQLPDPTDDVITWGPWPVAAGESYTFTFTAVVTPPADYEDTVTNRVEFASANAGSGFSNDAVFTIEPGQPALSVAKTVTPTADVPLDGGVVTYTIVVRNDGTAEATGVVLTDTLPPEVDFRAWVEQGSAQLPDPTDDVTWGPWPVAAGESYTFTFTAVVTPPADYEDTVTNRVEFASTNAGSGFSNDAVFTIESEPQPQEPDLSNSVKSSSSPGAQVMPGDLITYTITLSNTSSVAANVLVTDVLGAHYTVYDPLDLDETASGGLTWSGPVAGNGTATLQFVVQVVDMADLGFGITTLSNTAEVHDGYRPYTLPDAAPPYVEVYGIFMPLITRNS